MHPPSKFREWLAGESDPLVLIVGNGHVTACLVAELDDDVSITVLTDDPVVARVDADAPDHRIGGPSSVEIVKGDPASVDAFGRAGANDATVAVVTLETDAGALLTTRLLRAKFDVPEVIALVEDPEVDAVDDVETICASDTIAAQVRAELEGRYIA